MTIQDAFDKAARNISSSVGEISRDFARAILNPGRAGVETGIRISQSAPVQSAVREAASRGTRAAEGIGSLLTAPLRAVGSFVDNTTTKILLIGALALVAVVVVKKVID